MTTQLPEVAQALLDPSLYPDPTNRVEMMQTQMSFIFLTGKFVYKLRKPVNLGYLDYSSLEKRHHFSQQELVLNRRLSPKVYLDVIPVKRSKGKISLNGQGETIDYVVKMVYLPQNRMMNVLLDRNRVTSEMVEQLAHKLVEFHTTANTSSEISSFGKIENIKYNTDENFSQTEKYFGVTITEKQFQNIKQYTNRILEEKADIFQERESTEKIKDCHGDLHSQHICFTTAINIFDCIEFNDRFRYCDVASEIAFLAMDLDHYGRADLSRSFTDAYIALSRDEKIKEVLKFYKCYRAYVRGKVGCFKYDDPYISEEERKQTLQLTRGYFELAESYTRSRPRLFITVGLVGSGKSTLSQGLAKRLGLTVISSDIIRKQIAEVPVKEHHYNEMDTGIYSEQHSRLTYDRLYSEAERILNRGDSVILDASFIKSEERQKAARLAGSTQAELFIVECKLDEDNTRLRLARRMKKGSVSDGRWDIFEPQKKKFEPVTEAGNMGYFVIDTSLQPEKQIDSIITRI
jgi:uncharacterized protein